jgi:hypothetical protein
MGTPTGSPIAIPVPPRPVHTLCPCGADYYGHDGDAWFRQHQKDVHPVLTKPEDAEKMQAAIDHIKEIVATALREGHHKDAVNKLAEFLEVSV